MKGRGAARSGLAPMCTHSATTSTNDDGFRRLEVITGVGRRRRWTEEAPGAAFRCTRWHHLRVRRAL